MKYARSLLLAVAAMVVSTASMASTAASGQIISGTTFGTNNAFQFFNDSTAGEYITSLTWNLTPINGFFDTTNVSPGNSSSGLAQGAASDNVGAMFPSNASQDGLSTLTINFAANSFAAGKKFIFGVDTDLRSCLDCTGINGPGFVGATVSAVFSNGETRYGTYVLSQKAGFGSEVSITSVTPVPEPETVSMLVAGLALMGVVARRRKARTA